MTLCKLPVIFCLMSVALSATAGDESTANEAPSLIWDNFRLPGFIHPIHYHLKISPNINESTFTGQTDMTLRVAERALGVITTDWIVFHANNLDIDPNIQVQTPETEENPVTVTESGNITRHQMYYVKFSRAFNSSDTFTLKVRYNGTIGNGTFGLYKGHYYHEGKKRYMISTQMQPTFAREVFPCLDEPAFKATFSMELDTTGDDVALFNTERVSQYPGTNCAGASNCTTHRFNSTYRMSTYLVAFAVGRFESRSIIGESGHKVTIWFRPGKANQTDYALQSASKVIRFYEEFFDMEIPLKRLDMLAVTNHLGAMESVGLNIFREDVLLYNEKTTPEHWRKLTISTIAHEVAHEWFGNMVTLMWWNELYVNEGFATYFAALGVNAIDNSVNADEFMSTRCKEVMAVSSWPTASAIRKAVTNNNVIRAGFTGITYKQTACVLRMLESVIGRDAMKAGLRKMLREYKFKNIDGGLIWEELEKESEGVFDLDAMMSGWINQAGYPVVTITRETDHLQLTQERFLRLRSESSSSRASREKWEIPFTFRLSNSPKNQQKKLWLKGSTQTETVANLSTATWLIGNVRSKGLYRVNYDADNWGSLADQLVSDHTVFSRAERQMLLDDALSLARVNFLAYPTAFKMLRYLTLDDSYDVWMTAKKHLIYIWRRLELEEELPLMLAFIRNHLLHPKLRGIGWDPHVGYKNTRELRKSLVRMARKPDYYVKEHAELFTAWKADKSVHIHPDIKLDVFMLAVMTGSQQDWELIFSRAFEPGVDENTQVLKSALTTSRDPELLHRLLEFCLTHKEWDIAQALGYVSRNTNGQLVAWTFFKQHMDTIISRSGKSLNSYLFNFLKTHDDDFDLGEITAFVGNKDLGEKKDNYDKSILEVRANLQWQMTRKAEVITWLRRTMEVWANCTSSFYVFAGPPTFAVVSNGTQS